VFCFNDLVALGLIAGLQRDGVAVGRDIRVVGFDDIEEAALAWPDLSSVSCDIAGFGQETARALLDWLDNGTRPPAERRARSSAQGARLERGMTPMTPESAFARNVRCSGHRGRPDAQPRGASAAETRGRVVVIGAGKASARMAEAVEAEWGPCEGLVITRYGYARPCKGIEIVEAAHPVPDAAGVAATARMLELLAGVGRMISCWR
jgi:hypothetical protein